MNTATNHNHIPNKKKSTQTSKKLKLRCFRDWIMTYQEGKKWTILRIENWSEKQNSTTKKLYIHPC